MPSRNVYSGSRRKLVLAFDIGTTYSGISYSVLDPRRTPVIKGVTWYRIAPELIIGASKIPTIIYYDQAGKVRAVGAEATREGIYEEAQDDEWFKSEWFKLHLRSKFGAGKNITDNIPPLPYRKSVIQVFADFLLYLLECASSYIQETEPNGEELWKSVQHDIDFVLSHPNGWEGKEQSQMRQAAVWAKLIPDTTIGHARLSFVTEGEASLHFAIQSDSIIKRGEGVVIVDAGGGTIDFSSYRKTAQGLTYEEIAPPQCYFHGSVFVSTRARIYLSKFLSESKFLNDLDTIVESFDKTTKVRFRSENDPQYIKFGSLRDNDPHCNIRFGQLKLSGSDVASFFKPSVDCIVNVVLDQKKSSHHPISHIVLVGGFAASDWLFHTVERSMSKHGLIVIRPESHVDKAVSDGAIAFYLDTTDVPSTKTTNPNTDIHDVLQRLPVNTKKFTGLPTDAQKNHDLAKGSVNQVHIISSVAQSSVVVGLEGSSEANHDSGVEQHVANVLSTSNHANHSIQGLTGEEIAKNLQINGNGNNIYFILQNYEKQMIIGDNYNDPGRQGDTFTGTINNAAVGGRENTNRLVNKGKR